MWSFRRFKVPARWQSAKSFPREGRVVVCGGGIIGSSVSYHLAKRGWNDVIMVEQGRALGCGTTWHAAGLVGFVRPSLIHMKMGQYTRELFETIETETGFSTGWKQRGSLRVATTNDRMTALKRSSSLARLAGVETHIVSPEECEKLNPWMRTDDLKGALWTPQDGTADPTDFCQALSKGAAQRGVTTVTGTKVEVILTSNGRVCGVETDKGQIKCEYFVNCGGLWAHQLGKQSKPEVAIPLHPVEHFYVVTQPISGVSNALPVVRDPDSSLYVREWSGGFCTGWFEPNAKPCFTEGIPNDFEFQLFPEDWDHLTDMFEKSIHRFPVLKETQIRQQINGPETFTPDSTYMMGEAPEIKNYFVATGMNSSGIANAAGVGKSMAEFIIDGKPSLDLCCLDVKRFLKHHNDSMFLQSRVSDVVYLRNTSLYPGKGFETGKIGECSPLSERQRQDGGVFAEVMGYETVKWFGDGNSKTDVGTFSRPPWLRFVHKEMLAMTEASALFDLSHFTKLEIKGAEVSELLMHLCCVNTNIPVGSQLEAFMLNKDGGIEVHCQLIHIRENTYLVVTPPHLGTRTNSWIQEHLLADDSSVTVTDVSERFSFLSLIGPTTNDILSRIAFSAGKVNVSKDNNGKVANLLMLVNSAVDVYDDLTKAGAVSAGMYALDGWKVDNAIGTWGNELSPYTTPLEAGMGAVIDYSKEFIGKDAIMEQKEEGIKKKLALFKVEDPTNEAMPWGKEPIVDRDGNAVGVSTSAAVDVQKTAKCLGYVHLNGDSVVITDGVWMKAKSSQYTIEISGKVYPATIESH